MEMGILVWLGHVNKETDLVGEKDIHKKIMGIKASKYKME